MLLRYGLGLSLMLFLYVAGNRWLWRPLSVRHKLSDGQKKLLSHAWLYGPCLLVLWWMIRTEPKVPATTLLWTLSEYLIVFAAGLFFMPLIVFWTLVETKLSGKKLTELQEDTTQAMDSRLDWLFILVLAPFFEELFIRKFLYDRLAGENLMLFLLFGALCFGLMHVVTGRLAMALSNFYLGFIFGLVYAASGSLLVTALFHAATNLCILVIPESLEKKKAGAMGYRCILFIVGCIGFLWLLLQPGRFLPLAIRAQTGAAMNVMLTNPGTWGYLMTTLVIYFWIRRTQKNLGKQEGAVQNKKTEH